VGDHVVLSLVPVCGQCPACLQQRPNFCHQGDLQILLQGLLPDGTSRQKRPNGEQLRALGALGCMAEETVVKDTFAVKIDPSIPFDRACLVGCGVITGAAGAIHAGDVRPGNSVAVFGCGGVGLSAIQGARIAGANMIIGVDVADNKLAWASKLGATHTIKSGEENAVEKIMQLTGQGADISFECVGVPELMSHAYDAVRQGGTAVILGIAPSQDSLPINPFSFALFGKTIRGSKYGSSNPLVDIPMLLGHYQMGQLDLDTMVTQTYTIDEIKKAFEDMENNVNARGVISFE
jgi:S-(hydroxymethyl)glutathione dehydrogenase/alcohol dehydrogenase